MADNEIISVSVSEKLRLHWQIENYQSISEQNRAVMSARARIMADKQPSSQQGTYTNQEALPDNFSESRQLTIYEDKIYLEMVPTNPGNFVVQVSLWGERGMLLAYDIAGEQKFEVKSKQLKPGYRPGYSNETDTYLKPASAPEILDFKETDIALKDLDEEQFRNTIAETIKCMDNLGLNRDNGKTRAEAYLDMVTWDEAYRKVWTDDNSEKSSSCGMFVRNTWWLCGARGAELFDKNYKGGVITKLLNFNVSASKKININFTNKTFMPKIGDVIYLYKGETNSQHIFTICEIDKKIEFVDGWSTVFNEDGSPATKITFTSVDGGQSDGSGKDSAGKIKKWSCHAIKKVTREMKLDKNGHFINIASGWPRPDGTMGRPINTWIDVWELRDKFTANYMKPVRQ